MSFTISSSNTGLLPPLKTTVQRTAISSPPDGLIVYDTDLKQLFRYNGSTWGGLLQSAAIIFEPVGGSVADQWSPSSYVNANTRLNTVYDSSGGANFSVSTTTNTNDTVNILIAGVYLITSNVGGTDACATSNVSSIQITINGVVVSPTTQAGQCSGACVSITQYCAVNDTVIFVQRIQTARTITALEKTSNRMSIIRVA